MNKETLKECSDLGMAAYLKIHGFKVVGRRGRRIYFEVPTEQHEEFDQLTIDYCSTVHHEFDSALMALKKLPDYMPKDKAY